MKLLLIIISFLFSRQFGAQVKYESVFKTDRHNVTDNIFTMVRPDWTRNFVVGNITVVKTGEGLIVFDGGNNPEVASHAIREIKKDTDLPVKYLIISHGHIDHTGGISEFKKEWPEMEIIGHNTVYPYMQRDQQRVKSLSQRNYERWNKRDSLMAEIKEKYKDSEPMQEYFEQYYMHDLLDLAKQYEKTKVSLPTITIEDSVNIYLAGKIYKVFKAGNGNTQSDIQLYIPHEKVLCTGDVSTRPVPYGFTEYGFEWISVLDKILELEIDWVIPGHGDPLKCKEYLQMQRRLFTAVLDQVKEGISKGKSEEEIRENVRVDEYRNYFTKGDPVFNNRFDVWFLDPFISRNFRKMTAEL